MVKKILQIGVLICVISLAFNVFAQDDKKPQVQDYPRMGFWSNWSIGADFGGQFQLAPHTEIPDGGGYWGLGAHLFIQKRISPLWNLRLTLGSPRFYSITGKAENAEGDVFGTATIDVMWSIINGFKYNPNRKVDLFWLAGGGASLNNNNKMYGKLGLFARTGFDFDWYVCKHSTLFLEATIGLVGDIPHFKSWFNGGVHRGEANVYMGVGYMYNFGLTKADETLLAQRAILTQENFDALNNQVSDLESDLAASKQNERRLENRISDLESEVAMLRDRPATANGGNANSDSLQQRINQMKQDQLSYYALPFSILFGVDEYTVSGAEQTKLKAIAAVMKSDTNLNLSIVGFCDQTGPSDEYNMKLSKKRAENVKKVLVNRYGIKEDRLTCDWKGRGVAYGDGKLSINRRVSFYRVIE